MMDCLKSRNPHKARYKCVYGDFFVCGLLSSEMLVRITGDHRGKGGDRNLKSNIKSIDSQSDMRLYVDDFLSGREPNTFDLIFVLEGNMRLISEQGTFSMAGNDIVIINKFNSYELEQDSPHNLFFVFEISDTLMMQSTEIDGLTFTCNSIDALDKKRYDDLRNQIHRIIEILLIEERRANFLLFSQVYQLLNEIISNFSVQSKVVTKKDIRIRKMVQYIYDHYQEELSLQSMADSFYMDAAYFSKFFKKHAGINFKEYVVNLRLNFAERDLRDSAKSIVKIAIDNGFSNVNSFNNAFKVAYGVPPSFFREQEKRTEEIVAERDHADLLKRYQKYKAQMELEGKGDDQSVSIDVQQKEEELHSSWNRLINVGEAEELLSDGMKKHIIEIKRGLDFQYARIWGIFTDRLFTDWTDFSILNYEKLDEVFDFLTENKIEPWIELNKGNQGGKKSHIIEESSSQWKKLFSAFMEHVVNRYGRKAVSNWRFEVTLHNTRKDAEFADYHRFFETTRDILKRISKQIQIGGASIKVGSKSENLPSVLQKLDPLGVDFYSFMLYPYEDSENREERNSHRITDENFLINRVAYIKGVMESWPDKEIFVTEWNNTVSNKNIINDTLYKGTYLIKNIMDTLNMVDGLGYWIASDLYHSNPRTTEILNGGSGLLNKYGMNKPAMYALLFLEELKGLKLVAKERDVLVCRVDDDELLLLAHNYVHPNQLYFLKNEDQILPNEVESFFTHEKKAIQVNLNQLQPGKYEVRMYSCNQQNGSLFDKWKDLGFDKELRPSDISYMKDKNTIHMQLERITVEKDHYEIEKLMEPNEFFMVSLRKETRIV